MKKKLFKTDLILPIFIFLSLSVILVYVSKYFKYQKTQEIRFKTDLIANQLATSFSSHFESHLAIVKFLREEWLRNNINTPLKFGKVALPLIQSFHGFQAINYIDPEGFIRWVYPEKANIAAKGKDLHDHPLAAESFILSEKTGNDCATPAIELWQGGLGVATYFPLIRDGRLEGYLNGVFRIDNFIHVYFNEGMNQNFYLHLKEEGHEFYSFETESDDFNHPILSEYPISILNREWTISLSPRPILLEAINSQIYQYFFLLSIVLSGIFAYVIRLLIFRRQEILNSERKYRELFEKSDDAILIIRNGHFVDCNQATVKLLRYNEKQELLNTHPSELSPDRQPDGRLSNEKADEMMKTALDNGSHRFEWDHKKADGEVFPVEVLLTPIHTSDENTIIHTVWRDITERKEADQLRSVVYRISESTQSAKDLDDLYKAIHASLKPVLDVTNFYIAIYDEKEQVLSFPYYVDEKDSQPSPTGMGHGLTEYIIKIGKSCFLNEKAVQELNTQGEIEIIGSLPQQWLGSPLIIRGKVIGIITVQSYDNSNLYTDKDLDILNYVSEQIALAIERKQSINELEVEKTYLEELFASSPEAVALMDSEGIILDINPEFTSLFGFTEKETIGNSIDVLLTDNEQRKNAEKLTREVHAGRRVFAEAIRRKKDGAMLPVSILGSPIKYKGGVLAVYASYRDITDRKKAENQLKKSELEHRLLSEQLIQTNNMKETLLDVLSHDLMNPASVIKGFSDLLSEEYGDNERIRAISTSSASLMNVITNAVTLSKVSLGESIDLKSLNITELIQREVDEFSSQLVHHDMELQIKLPDNLIVKANPIISEVFKNYLSNTIKYASDGKKVVIDADIEQDKITINFIDYGPTVPEDKRTLIFERNSQLGSGDKRGRGLGLAIVKRIAESHNANVGIKPNKPVGNIFYIEFSV